jgi:hypothetical protein
MVDPALQHAVTSVADYVGYVSVEAVEATDTAGTIAAASPKHIVDTLARLTSGADATITAALRAAAAPLDAPSMVVKAIRTEVRKQLTELADRLRRSLPSPPRLGQVTRPAPVERTTSSLRVRLGHRRGSVVTTTPAASADRTNRTEQADPDLTKPTTVNGATDLSDGNKAVPRAKGPKSPLRQRAEASLNEVRVSLKGLGDALRKAVTPAKPPRLHRSHRH